MEVIMNKEKSKNKIKDNTKVLFIRAWVAGAVYFFLAFGSSLGQSLTGIDLIFMLSTALGLVTIFIFDPIIYAMFDITKKGVIINNLYKNKTVVQGVIMKLFEFAKCFITVIFTFYTYYLINLLLNTINNAPQDAIILKGEPILFAVFYSFFYQLLSLFPSPFMSPKNLKE